LVLLAMAVSGLVSWLRASRSKLLQSAGAA
jgi:hypothetical protein